MPTWNEIYQYYGDARPYSHQIRALEMFVRSHGADPDTRFLLGVLYMMGGYQDAAARQLQVAHWLAPGDRETMRLLSMAAPELAVPRLAFENRPSQPVEQPYPARRPPPPPSVGQPSLGYQLPGNAWQPAAAHEPPAAHEPVERVPSFPRAENPQPPPPLLPR